MVRIWESREGIETEEAAGDAVGALAAFSHAHETSNGRLPGVVHRTRWRRRGGGRLSTHHSAGGRGGGERGTGGAKEGHEEWRMEGREEINEAFRLGLVAEKETSSLPDYYRESQ